MYLKGIVSSEINQMKKKFPGCAATQRSSVVIDVAQVAAVMQAESLARKLPHAVGVTKKKKKNQMKKTNPI